MIRALLKQNLKDSLWNLSIMLKPKHLFREIIILLSIENRNSHPLEINKGTMKALITLLLKNKMTLPWISRISLILISMNSPKDRYLKISCKKKKLKDTFMHLFSTPIILIPITLILKFLITLKNEK